MKNVILIGLAVLALASCEKKHGTSECYVRDFVLTEAVCTDNYDPVCGCDGNTYANSCVAKFHHGIKSHTPGACTGCDFEYEGEVVDYTGLDGCGLVIKLDSDKIVEPNELPQGFSLKAGTRVEFDYLTADAGSYCMVGEVVNITCIREVSCVPVHEPKLGHSGTQGYDDPITINKAEVVGDCLEINFSHGGGCEMHEYVLAKVPQFCGTPPVPPVTLEFLHNANGDLCEALLTKTLSFDLSSLRDTSTNEMEFYLKDRHATYSKKFVYHY